MIDGPMIQAGATVVGLMLIAGALWIALRWAD